MDIEAEMQETAGFKDYFLANVTLPLLSKGAKEEWLSERLLEALMGNDDEELSDSMKIGL